MGVHYRKEVKVYQVLLVLVVAFLMVFFIHDMDIQVALRQYAILMAVTAAMAILGLGVMYMVSRASGTTGIKEGTKVTDEREGNYHGE